MPEKDYTFISTDTSAKLGGKVIRYSCVTKAETLSGIKTEEVVFLNPYKENWGISKNDVRKGTWGSSRSVFCAVWIKVKKKDFSNFNQIRLSYEEVTDQSLIKNLNKQSKFFITDKEPNLPWKKKIIISVYLHLDRCKKFFKRTFLNN